MLDGDAYLVHRLVKIEGLTDQLVQLIKRTVNRQTNGLTM